MRLSSNSTQSSFIDTLHNQKLYEMRVIKTIPQFNDKYIKLSEQGIPIKKNFAKLIGCWNTEFGELNTIIQLWEFDSYREYKDIKEKLETDAKWQKTFVDKAPPMLIKEENMTMRKISDEPLSMIEDPGADSSNLPTAHYRLNIYALTNSLDRGVLKFKEIRAKYFKSFTDDKKDNGSVCVSHLGTFLPESDKMNQLFEFVRHNNMDDKTFYKKRSELQQLNSQLSDVAQLVSSQILLPLSFSPLK
ncbi:unnamed protein product [Gordionus sp. m RMFG-2023]|uniref:protein NipSnap homolog 3A-like n=1 Tax=Gordionus sp. m RMFG-2023 TaxID=3053472 RepID=UPI0030E0A8DB